MPPGQTPTRPYRDIGVVYLTNCQEYTTGPCRTWLVDGVCELGGNVAYLLDPAPPNNELDVENFQVTSTNAINFRVTAGVFAVEEGAPQEAQTCKEPPANEPDPEMERCLE